MTEQTAVWTDEQYAAYALGMRTERELQEALARLAMEKHQAEIAAQAARIEELEGTLDQVATESDMIFDRGAQRLARIKELEAELAAAQQEAMPVPDGHLRVLLDFVETTLGDIMEVRKVREWLAAQPKQGEE